MSEEVKVSGNVEWTGNIPLCTEILPFLNILLQATLDIQGF